MNFLLHTSSSKNQLYTQISKSIRKKEKNLPKTENIWYYIYNKKIFVRRKKVFKLFKSKIIKPKEVNI